MTARRAVALAIALLQPIELAAEDAPILSPALEMPGHRALARVRAVSTLAPFTTDGCSGGMSQVWTVVARQFPDFATIHGHTPPWESCCVTHDRAYHSAGPDPSPASSYAARLVADGDLRACVYAVGENRRDELSAKYGMTPEMVSSGYEAIADAIYSAVRLGGAPCTGLPWRWGYGYPNCIVTPGDLSDMNAPD